MYERAELEVLLAGLNIIDPHSVFTRQLKGKIINEMNAPKENTKDEEATDCPAAG